MQCGQLRCKDGDNKGDLGNFGDFGAPPVTGGNQERTDRQSISMEYR